MDVINRNPDVEQHLDASTGCNDRLEELNIGFKGELPL